VPTEPRPTTTNRIGYLLKRAQSALNAAMTTALAGHGVTMPQYAVLVALDEEPGLSNADLARRAFVTPQTMNQVLRELEDKHLVLRRPHPVHGRVLQARLTGGGQQTLHHCRQSIDMVEDRMLAHFPLAQQRQLAQALRTCAEALTQVARE
jgi:DNA-binding MarR family transcriptional regulator